jgi:hypothetical protein
MASAVAPDERMPMPVPVGRRLVDGPAHLLPRLEPTPLQRQRLEHLPPRLDQVQVRGVHRLEDELPAGMRQAEQQHVGRPVGTQVVEDRVDPRDLRRDPRLDVPEEVGPVRRRAAAVGAGEGLAGGRAEGAEDVPLAAAAVVGLFFARPAGRRRPSASSLGSVRIGSRPGTLLAACGPISSRQMTALPSGGAV